MKRSLVASVIALTIGVTAPARAADTAPAASAAPTPAPVAAPAASPAAAAPVAAPPAEAHPTIPAPPSAPQQPNELVLRAARPINLAPEPAPTPWPYKMAFAALVAGAIVVGWKKRDKLRAVLAATKSDKKPQLDVRVLGRTPMGLRGEIVLVEAGGSRVLVGVTATSMTTLALLPDDGASQASMMAAEEVEENEAELSERARVILGARPTPATFSAQRYADQADEPAPRPRPKPERELAPARLNRRAASEAPLEGQARGLAFALGNVRGPR